MKTPYFLFDIDGTLLHVERTVIDGILTDAFTHLPIEKNPAASFSFSGRTDHDIFLDLLHESHRETGYPIIKSFYIKELEKRLEVAHVTFFQDAARLISYCNEQGWPIGLLTGNYRQSASTKLNRAGCEQAFSWGIFGCNHTVRADLAPMALSYIQQQFDPLVTAEQLIVIGDTPKDVSCAQSIGAKCVAVATGVYTVEELSEWEPTLTLSNLSSPERWLNDVLP